MFNTLQCLAAYAPDLNERFRGDVFRSVDGDKALKKVEQAVLRGELGRTYQGVIKTSQAVDLVEGGVKVNALPERASAIANYRISVER